MSFAIQLLKEGEGDEANKREERVRKQSVTKSTCNVQKELGYGARYMPRLGRPIEIQKAARKTNDTRTIVLGGRGRNPKKNRKKRSPENVP